MIKLIIPGRPVPKHRPRKGRYGNFYTPSETTRYENSIAFYTLRHKKIERNVRVNLAFYIHSTRCDIDNLIKSCLDGLKHLFNDNKVVEIHARKIISKDEKTEIEIE